MTETTAAYGAWPALEAAHAGHELVLLTGKRDSGAACGLLACYSCAVIVGRAGRCSATTRAGERCRGLAWPGAERCASHGGGDRGRTNRARLTRPRHVWALGLGVVSEQPMSIPRTAL